MMQSSNYSTGMAGGNWTTLTVTWMPLTAWQKFLMRFGFQPKARNYVSTNMTW